MYQHIAPKLEGENLEGYIPECFRDARGQISVRSERYLVQNHERQDYSRC
jgi:hypothetical protein